MGHFASSSSVESTRTLRWCSLAKRTTSCAGRCGTPFSNLNRRTKLFWFDGEGFPQKPSTPMRCYAGFSSPANSSANALLSLGLEEVPRSTPSVVDLIQPDWRADDEQLLRVPP